ncbi:hypothetical protein PFICI_06356 [Pestalotiopsis fici W106-1]|uniref:Pyrroline-5-carboxylate reductase dimerisation domain-containing protein n=1 Tax=Pestalotiopsis fici (strain W106-1 / CGMCC3.15140) TaxID=1229662 RepID=W3X5R3_PESFW|nr:uncharacterized protein PFICI_06356 [Pestalotiopsis fici W106-1]ETS81354.1 hypothetical protein PFICI_06356 [Pestalotiopsis fici W106-1]
MHHKLTIIGCGVFGRSIVDGLLSSESSPEYRLALTHRRFEALKALQIDYPDAVVSRDNGDPLIWDHTDGAAIRHVVLIATQPRFTSNVCKDICNAVKSARSAQELVVVTVCPGITLAQLKSWLPCETTIIRAMPNTPISISQGATALFASESAPCEVVSEVRAIFRRISPVVAMLPREELMDVAAAVSGSGPAYVYYLLQALVATGSSLGLPSELAHQLVVQSCMGAVMLVKEAAETPLSDLLAHVCVAGGSTEKAMSTLNRCDLRTILQTAVEESWHANQAMGKDV